MQGRAENVIGKVNIIDGTRERMNKQVMRRERAGKGKECDREGKYTTRNQRTYVQMSGRVKDENIQRKANIKSGTTKEERRSSREPYKEGRGM